MFPSAEAASFALDHSKIRFSQDDHWGLVNIKLVYSILPRFIVLIISPSQTRIRSEQYQMRGNYPKMIRIVNGKMNRHKNESPKWQTVNSSYHPSSSYTPH
jgi:hypothetical protein